MDLRYKVWALSTRARRRRDVRARAHGAHQLHTTSHGGSIARPRSGTVGGGREGSFRCFLIHCRRVVCVCRSSVCRAQSICATHIKDKAYPVCAVSSAKVRDLFNKLTNAKYTSTLSAPYMCRSTTIIMKIIYGLSHPGDVLGA